MKKQKIAILIVLLLLLILVSGVAAMSSANYRLDWFVPAVGTGGSAESGSYAIGFTVGQSASQPAAGSNYQLGLGFWSGITEVIAGLKVYLPVIVR